MSQWCFGNTPLTARDQLTNSLGMDNKAPLPQHVTRAEAAEVLRISSRQVDRLAKAGKLRKRRLSGSRRGFLREDLDHYLSELSDGTGYASPFGCLKLEPPVSCDLNTLAKRVDAVLIAHLPGCLVVARRGSVDVIWNAALGYTPAKVFEELRTLEQRHE